MYFCRWDQVSIKRLIKLNININTLSNMIHDICQEIFLMFDEIAYDVCQGREKLLSDNLPMFLLSDKLKMFLFSDNLTMFLISFFSDLFWCIFRTTSPSKYRISKIFSYKIIPGIVNNTVKFDYKWNMPLSLKLPLCDYWI